jgi:hypothetical protein
VSLVGKVYLAAGLVLFFVGVLLTTMTLQENAAWVEIVLWLPRLDLIEPLSRVRYEVNLSVLLGGWAVAGGGAILLALRLPFRVRGAAIAQRRIRELEREVLELRTLPLRQQEEDDVLAAEAHLDAGTQKVMTEKIRLERTNLERDAGAS